MRIVDVDWSSLSSVIKYAKTLRGKHLVIRHADRDNYNIAHYASLHSKVNMGASVYYITNNVKKGK